MCGRYTLTNPDPVGCAQRFHILDSATDFEPRYNVAPTDASARRAARGWGDA